MQLATAYATIANGGSVLKPQIAMQILAPGTPDSPSEPGYADLTRAKVVRSFEAGDASGFVNMPEDTQRGPIVRGLTRVIRGRGVSSDFYHSTTGEKYFTSAEYNYDALPIAGKTGTAQGAASLPWNDSSVFAAFSLDSSQPYTVTAYLEKAGYGSQAALPVVKCMFKALQGEVPLAPVQLSDPLDITSNVAAEPVRLPSRDCLGAQQKSTTTGPLEQRD